MPVRRRASSSFPPLSSTMSPPLARRPLRRPRSPNARPRGARPADSFQILVVHFRHFSSYVWPENNCSRLRIHASLAKKNVGEETVRTFARDFGAGFAAVTHWGVLLALAGVAFKFLRQSPMAPANPAPPAPATPAPATPAPATSLAAPAKQVPLKPALPLGISPQLYAQAVPPGTSRRRNLPLSAKNCSRTSAFR